MIHAFEPVEDTLTSYIREEIVELENPMRQDRERLTASLRHLHRAYFYTLKPKQDWSPAK
jgi:hypothetical protein